MVQKLIVHSTLYRGDLHWTLQIDTDSNTEYVHLHVDRRYPSIFLLDIEESYVCEDAILTVIS